MTGDDFVSIDDTLDSSTTIDETLDSSSTTTGYTDFASLPPLRYRQEIPHDRKEYMGCAPFFSLLLDDPFKEKMISGRMSIVQPTFRSANINDIGADDDEDGNTEVIYSTHSPSNRGQPANPVTEGWTNTGKSRDPFSSSFPASSSVGSEGPDEATYNSKTIKRQNSTFCDERHDFMIYKNGDIRSPYEGSKDGV
jgi:hypothetical protein